MTRSKTQPGYPGVGMGLGARNSCGSPNQNERNGTSPVILDCRNLLEFTRSQLTDHAGRRRLQQGKMAVLDFIGSGSGQEAGHDSLKRLWTKGGDPGMGDFNGLDDDTTYPRSPSLRSPSPQSPPSFSPPSSAHSTLTKPKPREREGGHSLPTAHSLHLVLNSLNREQDEENGKVHLSLPLSSSLPASLSDESVMTPDVENAAISPILPFLFLGNERDAQDLDLLLHLNIGFVVNVTTHLPLYHLNTGLVRYKRLPATDNSRQNLRQYFEEVFEFIEEARDAGRGVLVHCQAGVSRSATIVIAYLMKHTLMTMMDAYKYVRGRRPVVSPNLNFMGQLLEFERDLNSGVTPRILTPKLSGLETQV
ncbi:dual specificity protein phosphatase 10 [Megalops cyprinoides]|uniref:dual specificity protein phosphatase 10 n=1 Tax=Megalops cyprinoides TaxID=118141 RepID=UPI001864A993|nr:dual specificity protein phosphatase 10 [Megalops cyprinoides]